MILRQLYYSLAEFLNFKLVTKKEKFNNFVQKKQKKFFIVSFK